MESLADLKDLGVEPQEGSIEALDRDSLRLECLVRFDEHFQDVGNSLGIGKKERGDLLERPHIEHARQTSVQQRCQTGDNEPDGREKRRV